MTNSDISDELLKVGLNTTDNDSCFEEIEDDIPSDEIYPTQICAGGEKNKVRLNLFDLRLNFNLIFLL